MKRSVRKLSHTDFAARVAVVEKAYVDRTPYALRRDKTGERPLFWAGVSLMWSWFALYISFHRPAVKQFLGTRDVPVHLHDPIMAGVAAALMMSIVFLLYHIGRALFRARGYYNSGSILVGFSLAVAIHLAPASLYQNAYGMLGSDTQQLLTSTASRVSQIGWNDVVAVTSRGGDERIASNR